MKRLAFILMVLFPVAIQAQTNGEDEKAVERFPPEKIEKAKKLPAPELVTLMLISSTGSLIPNVCQENATFPFAQLATFLFVQRSLNASFEQGHAPIILMNGSGLGASPEQRYLISRGDIGIRNVAGLTDLLAPDAYIFGQNEKRLETQTQTKWTRAIADRNTPIVGTDLECGKRSPSAALCQHVVKSLRYVRGTTNITIVATGDDDAGQYAARHEIGKHNDADVRVWVRHATDEPVAISELDKDLFTMILTEQILGDSERSPKVIVIGRKPVGTAVTLKKNPLGTFSIINEQSVAASELDSLSEPAWVLKDIQTVFCDAWTTDFVQKDDDSPYELWTRALSADAEIVVLPQNLQSAIKPSPWNRLTNDQLLAPTVLSQGIVTGKNLRKGAIKPTTSRHPVDDRAEYEIVGRPDQLVALGARSVTPIYSRDARQVLMQDVVWEQRREEPIRGELNLHMGIGPTYGLTRVFVPEEHFYPHRVFDGSTGLSSGFEGFLTLNDETRRRRLTFGAEFQFGVVDDGTEEEPSVDPTRDQFSASASWDWLAWSAANGYPFWLPVPRTYFRLNADFSRERGAKHQRVEPEIRLGPNWALGRYFDIGVSLSSKIYLYGQERQAIDPGVGFSAEYRLRPFPLVHFFGQPLSVSSRGEYSRFEMGDDFAIEIRHRHEIAQRFFDIVELYGVVDWFDFGRATVGTFAEHTQWLAGLRATFFIRRGRLVNSHE